MQYQRQFSSQSISRILSFFVLLVLTQGCASVALNSGVSASTVNTDASRVTGFIVTNDGATPVFNATIALLANEATPNAQEGGRLQANAGSCAAPAKPYIRYACSKEDGSFTLDISAVQQLPVTLRIALGADAREMTLGKQQLNADLGSVALTTESLQGKDKVAVVMDFYNPFEQIKQFLNDDPSQLQSVKLQLMNEYQTLYQISSDSQEISYPSFYSLFSDNDDDGKADIFRYDVVYINSRDESDIALLDESIRKKLLAYIASGGQLYVTEWTVEVQSQEPELDQYI